MHALNECIGENNRTSAHYDSNVLFIFFFAPAQLGR